ARTKKLFSGGTVTLIAADVVLNAQVAIMRVPKDFVLTNISATYGDCDTGATLSSKIGDAGDDDRFMAAATTGQAGGSSTTLAGTGLNYQFPADTDILHTAAVAAVGLGPTPTISLVMEGYMV